MCKAWLDYPTGHLALWPCLFGCPVLRDPTNFYPYSAGFKHEVGGGPGTGFNINIPWTKRGMVDADYMVGVAS